MSDISQIQVGSTTYNITDTILQDQTDAMGFFDQEVTHSAKVTCGRPSTNGYVTSSSPVTYDYAKVDPTTIFPATNEGYKYVLVYFAHIIYSADKPSAYRHATGHGWIHQAFPLSIGNDVRGILTTPPAQNAVYAYEKIATSSNSTSYTNVISAQSLVLRLNWFKWKN